MKRCTKYSQQSSAVLDDAEFPPLRDLSRFPILILKHYATICNTVS